MGSEYRDFESFEDYLSAGVKGEKLIVYRTDILRQHPFPEIRGTNFIPEAQQVLRLRGKVRCVNEAWRIYYPNEPDNLTGSKWRHSWRGMLFYYAWLFIHRPRHFWRSATAKACRALGIHRG